MCGKKWKDRSTAQSGVRPQANTAASGAEGQINKKKNREIASSKSPYVPEGCDLPALVLPFLFTSCKHFGVLEASRVQLMLHQVLTITHKHMVLKLVSYQIHGEPPLEGFVLVSLSGAVKHGRENCVNECRTNIF